MVVFAPVYLDGSTTEIGKIPIWDMYAPIRDEIPDAALAYGVQQHFMPVRPFVHAFLAAARYVDEPLCTRVNLRVDVPATAVVLQDVLDPARLRIFIGNVSVFSVNVYRTPIKISGSFYPSRIHSTDNAALHLNSYCAIHHTQGNGNIHEEIDIYKNLSDNRRRKLFCCS